MLKGAEPMTRTLDADAYWKLRALCSDAQRCELVAVHARADLATAHKKQTAALAALGLDPQAPTFTLDDDTLSITVPD
jgi:hypothetical protein